MKYNLGFWRYRVKNYRIIAKIEKDELVILIVQIDKFIFRIISKFIGLIEN